MYRKVHTYDGAHWNSYLVHPAESDLQQVISTLNQDGWVKSSVPAYGDYHISLGVIPFRDGMNRHEETMYYQYFGLPRAIPANRWFPGEPIEWCPLVWKWKCEYCGALLDASERSWEVVRRRHEATKKHVAYRRLQRLKWLGWVTAYDACAGTKVPPARLVSALKRYGEIEIDLVNKDQSRLPPRALKKIRPFLEAGSFKGLKAALQK